MHIPFAKYWSTLAALMAGMLLFCAPAAAGHPSAADQQVIINRIEVPAHPALRAWVQRAMEREMQAVKVAVQRRHSLTISRISWSPQRVVVIGHRLIQQRDHGQGSAMWLEEVRVTVPRTQLANSWDVGSLQKELERLGIKVKPRPQAPKPTQQISG